MITVTCMSNSRVSQLFDIPELPITIVGVALALVCFGIALYKPRKRKDKNHENEN